jgi:tetratricopeptide (TPR) repeat protein/transglutaminase-like putative cysteine protease
MMFRAMMFVGTVGVFGGGVFGACGIAHAGDKPIYADVPAWVKPAPPIDVSKLTDDAPVVLLIDNQQRLADGQVWAYFDSATRASSTQVLGAIGTIQLPWQPAHGDLIVHRVEIIRGTEHIDLLKAGGKFEVLRREQALDRRTLDGMLTATMAVAGLRVGDVLHFTASITRKDPTLKGKVQSIAPLIVDPFRVQFARVRLLWPAASDVRWKAYADGVTAKPVTANGISDLTITMPLMKQPDLPKDAPARFQKLPIVEASDFADWAAVAAMMTPLYATTGTIAPGSPLATEVARIAKAETDPVKRAALALALVQDKIRYLLMGMDSGNYVPQTPTQTWSLRYGDCKAKTVLLLAILRDLDIEAEPVLASSKFGDLLPGRLPTPLAFDHVLVRATVDGKPLWLDGTGSGARLADIRDTPPLGNVLPLHAGSATLVPIAMQANARADAAATIDLDQAAGLNFPALFKAKVVLRGGTAEGLRLATAQGNKDDLDEAAESIVKSYLDNPTVVSRDFSFDETAGTAIVEATGLSYPTWEKADGRLRIPLDTMVSGMSFTPDRARAAWRDIPVSLGAPTHYTARTTWHLPNGGAGFTLDGDQPLAATIAGTQVERTITRAGDTITIDASMRSSGGEMPAAALPGAWRKVAQVTARPARALAPADYPAFWQDVATARRTHRLDPVLAVFTRRIADKPEDAVRYTDRAWFLERIYDRRAAILDLDKALTLSPDVDTYLKRAGLYAAPGDKAKVVADASAAHQLDPASNGALTALADAQAENGDRVGALALLQESIDEGGDGKANFLAAKAEIEANSGDREAAIATIDAAIAQSPNKPALFNSRCWIKGTLNVALDTALKDCTKSIELTDTPGAALDSRAMVYFRMNRFDDALADLDAVLVRNPDMAASMFMRGIIRKRAGDAKAGEADLVAARMIAPQIAERYKKWGITP